MLASSAFREHGRAEQQDPRMSTPNTTSRRDLERLSRVVSHQNAQLRALNEANLLISEERLVSSVLQRVVDTSRDLSEARYAALGVFDDSGQLHAFLTSGLTRPSGKEWRSYHLARACWA